MINHDKFEEFQNNITINNNNENIHSILNTSFNFLSDQSKINNDFINKKKMKKKSPICKFRRAKILLPISNNISDYYHSYSKYSFSYENINIEEKKIEYPHFFVPYLKTIKNNHVPGAFDIYNRFQLYQHVDFPSFHLKE